MIRQSMTESDEVCRWLGLSPERLAKSTSLDFPHSTTTDQEVKKLIKVYSLQNLTSLNMGMCKISDKTLENIANLCPNLLGLNISFCEQISHKGIHAIISECKSLQELKLASCKQISEKDLIQFPWKTTRIKALDIGHCKQITPSGIQAIVSQCDYLESLNLAGLSINYKEACTLLNSRSISKINLSFCPEITSKKIKKMQKVYSNVEIDYQPPIAQPLTLARFFK